MGSNTIPKKNSEGQIGVPSDGGSWQCTGGSAQDHPQEKEKQKGKMVV